MLESPPVNSIEVEDDQGRYFRATGTAEEVANCRRYLDRHGHIPGAVAAQIYLTHLPAAT